MDRREFMKRVGTLGAAGLALSAVPWLKGCTAAGQEEIRGGRVRFGVIGTGSRGQYHMRNLLSVPNAGITALCDNYAHNLDKASAIAPGAKRYDDHCRLLEDPQVDAVIIAAPLHLHYRMALDAFAAGKHVLCEKAMAYTMEECFEMYRKGRASGRVFFVGQQRLFDPKYIRIMDSVRKGELGPVVNVRNYWYRNNDWRRKVPSPELERHINWRLYREYSRGLMTELACHQLQNGTWAMGMLPTQVMGTGNIVYWKDGREVFDSVSTIYTFPNGVNMTFESVIANKHFGMGEQILCKEGTVDLANGRLYMETPRRKSGIASWSGRSSRAFSAIRSSRARAGRRRGLRPTRASRSCPRRWRATARSKCSGPSATAFSRTRSRPTSWRKPITPRSSACWATRQSCKIRF